MGQIPVAIFKDDLRDFGTNDDNMYTNGEFNILSNLLTKNAIVFDVGASKGAWTKMALGTAVLKKLYCIEPIEEMCNQIGAYVFFRNNVKIVSGVVTDKIGKIPFHLYKNNQEMSEMSNLFGRPQVEQKNQIVQNIIEVNSSTIDRICETELLDHIDYLKIDTEGAELLVLKGSKNMLEQGRIKYVQFEYGGCFKDSGATLREVFKLLGDQNYALFRIIPKGLIHFPQWTYILENYLHSNYLAILGGVNGFLPIKIETPKEPRKRHKPKTLDNPEVL